MNIFRRPHYESEATLFLLDLKRRHPGMEAEQRAGRALLWDKVVDRQQAAAFAAARVPQKPYVYQV